MAELLDETEAAELFAARGEGDGQTHWLRLTPEQYAGIRKIMIGDE